MTTDETFSTIGDVAREFDISERALRFYEDKGLLCPARKGNRRVYSAADKQRLRLILRAKRMDFSLLDIQKLLELYDSEGVSAEFLKAALEKTEEQREVLVRERQEIEAAIEELETTIPELRARLVREKD